MRLSLRFIVPLLLALAAIAWATVPLADRLTLRWFVRDLDLRADLIATAVHDRLQDLSVASQRAQIIAYFERITQDERLYAMGFCPAPDGPVIAASTLPDSVRCGELARFDDPDARLLAGVPGPLYVTIKPLAIRGAPGGRLILLHDLGFIGRRSAETRKYLFYFFAGLGAAVSLITVVIAQMSWRGWEQGIRAVLRGEGLLRASGPPPRELRPLARDLRALIRDLENSHRPRDSDQVSWSPESLRSILHGELHGQRVIVVSNREPYLHVREGGSPVVHRPASGLVTALEPVMRACSGTWIAHGSGSADREVVDARDRIRVPPESPVYSLRRLWLSAQEEAGYYYGFANEGLWPLSHIAHVRPVFRAADWEQYRKVNARFARAVVEESSTPDPIVLVQDYHFALLPELIRGRLPDATIITFWHIPWPNPEAFAICPWREELLAGLLGSSILGFHTQFHCNNFLDTVDRMIEARVDREAFAVSHRMRTTAIRRYPISIDWPPPAGSASPGESRAAVLTRHDLPAGHRLGLGVDRLDYTKGIEERLRAVERLLELKPEWIGRFSFIQIAAPTRSSIEEYQAYEARVRALAARINARFAGGAHPPVILKIEHHDPPAVAEYYRAADFCFVSSLHDGMNLVAKEFVASRADERGVLVLSRFTGAARELPEALVVNPYDADQCAAALELALAMSPAEQRDRMRLMRALIAEFNVYRWAGRMLLDAAAMRSRRGFGGAPPSPA